MLGKALGIVFCMMFFLAVLGYADVSFWVAVPIVFVCALATLFRLQKSD